jgi:hypothetical protein
MNASRDGASCGAFRRHPCRRPRTFWHCPKGSWTSQRLAFLCPVRGACATSWGGFRWAPATSLGPPREVVPAELASYAAASRQAARFGHTGRHRKPVASRPLHCCCSAWSAETYRVGDETRMNNVSSQHDFTKQDRRAGHLGAARLRLWAKSPPSYVSAPPAHPVEPRARRGKCRLALSARSKSGLVDRLANQRAALACPPACGRPNPWSCSQQGRFPCLIPTYATSGSMSTSA